MKSAPAVWLSIALLILSASAPDAHAAGKARRAPAPARDFVGYTGTHWQDDFGIARGRCDRKAVATALAEPAAASAEESARVAVLAGLDLRDSDRACVAHALELTNARRPVRWTSETGKALTFRAGSDLVLDGLPCRQFVIDGAGKAGRGTACQAQPRLWEIQTQAP